MKPQEALANAARQHLPRQGGTAPAASATSAASAPVPTSMLNPTYRLVPAGLLLVATLPALLVGAAGWHMERQQAQATAACIAWVADLHEQQGRNGPAAPGPLPDPRGSGELHEIVAADGRPLASAGDSQARAWPAVVALQPLSSGVYPSSVEVSGTHEVGPQKTGGRATVRITRSLRPVLMQAGAVALACSVLAWTLWLRVFRRTMGALRGVEGRMREYTRHDALTGLRNREGLRLHLQRALARSAGTARTVAVLVIDLDRFRLVNDSLGQPAGDALLRGVADRIRAVTRPNDLVARLGGDQFAIVVEGLSTAQAAAAMARNLMRALEPAHVLAGRETVATLSIGVAVAGEHASTVDDLLKGADAAMRAAKHDGGGCFRLYEAAMDADTRHRLDLETRLRQALQKEHFFLVFQPIMDGRGQRVTGVEALMRWADPKRGVVSPNDFIPILEQTGLIVPVGRWALLQGCRAAARWRDGGARDLVLSVNVSPRQFGEVDFVATVLAVIAETGFPATQLQLEVTEGLLLDPTPAALAKIDALAASGVRLAIDDFGMGYSSLAYLKRFKLHSLKMDRMFVRDIATAAQDAAIARAIIDLGHGLGMRVTAEGVETLAQFHELRRLGCDNLQGFLFSQPVPEEALRPRIALPPVAAAAADSGSAHSTADLSLAG
jgi:diguanylate cyclase (GGDEF)-like protein